MLIPLDRGLDKPLHCQIHDHLADLIHKGVLAGGDRLPPTRQLSADNGVTRTTVNQAYEDLQAKGLVRTIVGAGTFVAGTGSRPESAPAESGSPSFDWESFIGDRSPPQDDPALSEMLDSTPPDTAVLNLLKPIPDPTLTPLYSYYKIDPGNKLTGDTPCGVQKYINYMILDVSAFINTECPDNNVETFCFCKP